MSAICYPDSNRIGRFNILYERAEQEGYMLSALFALCQILKYEPHESGRGVTFYAASQLFQPLLEGEEIPEYRIESVYDGNFDSPERERDRINLGRFGFVAIRQFLIRVPAVSTHITTHH